MVAVALCEGTCGNYNNLLRWKEDSDRGKEREKHKQKCYDMQNSNFVGLKGEDSDENKSIYFSNRGREKE